MAPACGQIVGAVWFYRSRFNPVMVRPAATALYPQCVFIKLIHLLRDNVPMIYFVGFGRNSRWYTRSFREFKQLSSKNCLDSLSSRRAAFRVHSRSKICRKWSNEFPDESRDIVIYSNWNSCRLRLKIKIIVVAPKFQLILKNLNFLLERCRNENHFHNASGDFVKLIIGTAAFKFQLNSI